MWKYYIWGTVWSNSCDDDYVWRLKTCRLSKSKSVLEGKILFFYHNRFMKVFVCKLVNWNALFGLRCQMAGYYHMTCWSIFSCFGCVKSKTTGLQFLANGSFYEKRCTFRTFHWKVQCFSLKSTMLFAEKCNAFHWKVALFIMQNYEV